MDRTAQLVAGLVALASCTDANPHVLWLAPDQLETHVMLVDSKPAPY